MKNVHMCYIRVTEGKIENLKKEDKMRISTLVFIYTIHFAYLKVSEKTLMKNVHMCYIRVTEGKIENLKKEDKMRISTLVFIYTIHFAYLKVHK